MSEFMIGIAGVIVGAFIQFSFHRLDRHLDTRKQRELDDARKALLKTALENPPDGTEWRALSTLSRIIGANYETTTRLLIELGARGSETENEVWALLTKKPLR